VPNETWRFCAVCEDLVNVFDFAARFADRFATYLWGGHNLTQLQLTPARLFALVGAQNMWLVGTSDVRGNLPFRLEKGEYIVGRTKRAHIVIRDATVSRSHARMVLARGVLTLEDLNSLNGTRVNECPVTQCELRVGDHVRFGYVACAVSSSPLSVRGLDEDESTHQARQEAVRTTAIEELTAAQREVADLILAGRGEAEIASILDKSPHTIHTHLKAIFQRLGVHSRAELIVKFLKRH